MGSQSNPGRIAALLYAQSTLRQVRDVMQQQGLESPVYFVEMAYVVVGDTLRKLTSEAENSEPSEPNGQSQKSRGPED